MNVSDCRALNRLRARTWNPPILSLPLRRSHVAVVAPPPSPSSVLLLIIVHGTVIPQRGESTRRKRTTRSEELCILAALPRRRRRIAAVAVVASPPSPSSVLLLIIVHGTVIPQRGESTRRKQTTRSKELCILASQPTPVLNSESVFPSYSRRRTPMNPQMHSGKIVLLFSAAKMSSSIPLKCRSRLMTFR